MSDEQYLSYQPFPAIDGVERGSYARAYHEDPGSVSVETDGLHGHAEVLLTPRAARALATQLLKAARWAEGDRT